MKSAHSAQQLIAPSANAAEALARIDALHAALTQIVLEGGNLSRIAAEVAGVLDVGVLITTTDGREKAAALPESLRAAMDDADLFDLTGRFRVERADTAGLPLGDGEVRMLPVVAGIESTRRHILFYTPPMIAAAVAPWALGLTGWIYGAASVVLGAIFLLLAFAVFANRATEPRAMGPEKRLFAFSIFYLFGLFAALVVDRWLV